MTDAERAESQRLLAIMESARSRFGASAVQRLEGPIRAAAGLEEPADADDPLRYPSGVFIPGLKSTPWHDRGWLPDVALLEAAAPAMRAETAPTRRGSSC